MKKLFQIMFIASIFTCTSIKSMEEESAANAIIKKNELAVITGLITAKIDQLESVLTAKFNHLENKIYQLERDHARTRNATISNLKSIETVYCCYTKAYRNCKDLTRTEAYIKKFEVEWKLT